ncbi:ABC transporter ATP-binding protein [Mucilaginibacter robiniae]|uniref:ABC transporter ATP-binding protein n=1 Tax=Mucilaginibacter robiniae TaxID=2728022 RepID=A0A7L5E2M4_9SPHI|nr:ABC transporter ATP-binding protein [Mucilaginibacter robiniae]QJD97542.1 ABC transporter ATP-binding protein [Mucilaginibacter robiniae]
MAKVIRAENISKAYRLGEISTGTLSQDLHRWWNNVRGKEDPFLKIGEANDRSKKGNSDVVWSLKDINFEIEQGDAVGIIGRNGAGKSTLLKLLSRVTAPTTGTMKAHGRIASLLEVGTGFHPELTGRENIYLNGAILGMRKSEINRKFDEIVNFSGVERYIDTPVKRYSSGMYVRLAFAVAAHLESEILIVDEVLAVGDAEFQKKCLGKMGDVSKGEGRTVLFVSHNMPSILELCNQGIYMKNGCLVNTGNINSVVSRYLDSGAGVRFVNKKEEITKPEIMYAMIDEDELEKGNLYMNFKFNSPFSLQPPVIGILINNSLAQPVFTTNPRMHSSNYGTRGKASSGEVSLRITDLPLLSGEYSVSCFLGDMVNDFNSYLDCLRFNFQAKNVDNSKVPELKYVGSVNIKNAEWKLL